MSTTDANSRTQTFISLFNNNTYAIPAYQRAYSWDEKEIKQFLQDLDDAQESYYLGHYLFEEYKKSDLDNSNLYIIDGQQRITTCVIFFSAIHKVLSAENYRSQTQAIMNSIHNNYLQDSKTFNQKLQTVEYDKEFFTRVIINNDTTAIPEYKSQKRIYEAYKFFIKNLENKTIEEINKYVSLVSNAAVTQLIVSNKTQAAYLFAFQNDRGKSLTNLETIKSYFMLQILLFGKGIHAPEHSLSRIESNFKKIYEIIESIELDEDSVLNYYWRGPRGKGFNCPPVVEGIKTSLSELEIGERVPWIENFTIKLADAFKYVYQIEKDNNADAQDLRNLKSMRLAYPILLRAFQDGAEIVSIERLYKFLENITFRWLLRGGRADIESRLNFFIQNNDKLDTENLVDKIKIFVENIINSRKQGNWWYHYWDDETLKEYLNKEFYGNPTDNYVLWKYECSISSHYSSKLKYTDLIKQESIEHIAPQTPEIGKLDMNGYGIYENANETNEGISSGNWLHKLGNLTLMAQSQNSSIKNLHFKIKLDAIKNNSLLKQHQEIAGFATEISEGQYIWDKSAIERRHNAIVKAALEIWDLTKI